MSENFDPLDQRVRKAFAKVSGAEASAAEPDIDALRARRPRAYSPKLPAVIAGTATSLVTVAAVVVAGAGVLGPREPLFTLAASAGVEASAASDASGLDVRMMPWIEYRYLPSDGLSREGGRGSVYQLTLEGDPLETLEAIAQAVGMNGEPRESVYFDPAYPGYVIGDEQGLGELLSLWWSGSGSWYYSNPAVYPQPVCTEVQDGDSFSTECSDPAAPSEPLLSEDEAKKRAAELFSKTGLSVTEEGVEVTWVDQWSINLSAALTIEGQPTAVEWYVSFGPGGALAYASGNAASIVDRGSYDTVSPYDAVERLNDGIWWGGAATEFYADMPISAMARGSEDFAVGSEETENTPSGDDSALDADSGESSEPDVPAEESEPAEPVEPEPPLEPEVPLEPEYSTEPEVIEVTVTESISALVLVFDAQGGWWLVPGYLMSGDEGWPNAVVALVDGVIELPQPMVGVPEPAIEPIPVD